MNPEPLIDGIINRLLLSLTDEISRRSGHHSEIEDEDLAKLSDDALEDILIAVSNGLAELIGSEVTVDHERDLS